VSTGCALEESPSAQILALAAKKARKLLERRRAFPFSDRRMTHLMDTSRNHCDGHS
jgi:uncharacterized protein (DUF1778 family)